MCTSIPFLIMHPLIIKNKIPRTQRKYLFFERKKRTGKEYQELKLFLFFFPFQFYQPQLSYCLQWRKRKSEMENSSEAFVVQGSSRSYIYFGVWRFLFNFRKSSLFVLHKRDSYEILMDLESYYKITISLEKLRCFQHFSFNHISERILKFVEFY